VTPCPTITHLGRGSLEHKLTLTPIHDYLKHATGHDTIG
jgi:hypothetical protein